MVKPQTAVGVVLPFPASRETQGNQTYHPIYQILARADTLMTALSLLGNSCTAMMAGVLLRNAAEILTQADAALRQAQNVMRRRPVTTTETRDVRQNFTKAAAHILSRLALNDATKELTKSQADKL